MALEWHFITVPQIAARTRMDLSLASEQNSPLNCGLQVLRARVAADGQPGRGFRKEHPQQVYPRYLYLHRPHERSQLWEVSVCAFLELISAAGQAFSHSCPDCSESHQLCVGSRRKRDFRVNFLPTYSRSPQWASLEHLSRGRHPSARCWR